MGIGTFFGLNIGVKTLEMAQQVESVVSNNISNSSTPGYTEESSVLVDDEPFASPGSSPIHAGQLGQGVDVQQVTRSVSESLNQLVRNNFSQNQAQTALYSGLNQLQGILGEPSSNGIKAAMDSFFGAWQTLSNASQDPSARGAVIQSAQNMVNTFSTISTNLQGWTSNTTNTIQGEAQQVNQQAQQIASLNQQIRTVQTYGQNPNQLLDQRDQLLNQMSQLGNISYQIQSDGTVNVNFGNVNVVNATQAPNAIGFTGGWTGTGTDTAGTSGSLNVAGGLGTQSVSVAAGDTLSDIASKINVVSGQTGVAASVQLVNGSTTNYQLVFSATSSDPNGQMNVKAATGTQFAGQNFALSQTTNAGTTSGSIWGNGQALSSAQSIASQLQTLQSTIASQVNSLQTAPGKAFDGTGNQASKPIFTTDSNGNVIVNPSLTAQDIAAAQLANSPGDGTNATQIFQLQTATQSSLGGATPDTYFAATISALGGQTAEAQNQQNLTGSLLQQSQTQQQSVSGVNLDEETAKMVQFQNIYSAAAKFISVTNDMLQTLIQEV